MGEDERKISVKNKDVHIRRTAEIPRFFFCAVRPQGDRRACMGGHAAG